MPGNPEEMPLHRSPEPEDDVISQRGEIGKRQNALEERLNRAKPVVDDLPVVANEGTKPVIDSNGDLISPPNNSKIDLENS